MVDLKDLATKKMQEERKKQRKEEKKESKVPKNFFYDFCTPVFVVVRFDVYHMLYYTRNMP